MLMNYVTWPAILNDLFMKYTFQLFAFYLILCSFANCILYELDILNVFDLFKVIHCNFVLLIVVHPPTSFFCIYSNNQMSYYLQLKFETETNWWQTSAPQHSWMKSVTAKICLLKRSFIKIIEFLRLIWTKLPKPMCAYAYRVFF